MNDEHFMNMAFAAAENGLYTTDPNPRVGCVLVRDGEVLATGWHQWAGQAHAEADALSKVSGDLSDVTAYVTLEPCSFEGRTPSCAKRLVAAGIKRVVAASADPHPQNQGAGFKILEDAGIDVQHPFMEVLAKNLNPGHHKKFEQGLPYVRLKLAMSLDGKTALANGESNWITGEEARRDVQRLRARSSAIVTGVQTVIDDDPRMTVRATELDEPLAEEISARARPVYILDSNGRTPEDAGLLKRDDVVVVTTKDASVSNLVMPANSNGQVDLMPFLRYLAEQDVNEVLFECGAALAGSLVAEGLCDELFIYVAPRFMGDSARSLLKLPEIDKMGDLFDLTITDVTKFGQDLRITAIPEGQAK